MMESIIKRDYCSKILSKLESFLAKSILEHVSEKLGSRTIKQIEKRLFEKYGLTLDQSIREFEKFDVVLREILGRTADKIEQQIFSKILAKQRSSNEFTVLDSKLCHSLLESYGDPYKKIILRLARNDSLTIYDIVKKTNIPQATVYRRINQLIDDGLLVDNGYVYGNDKKKIPLYTAILDNIVIDINDDDLDVFVKIKKDFIVDSPL